MSNEGFEQIGTVLNRSGMGAGHVGEFVGVGNRKVRHGIRLEVSPQVFDRIQLRRVGRREHTAHMGMGDQEVAHDNGAMRPQIVPDHHEGRTELAIQPREERHSAPRVDIGARCKRKYRRTRSRPGATHNAPTTLTLRCERVRWRMMGVSPRGAQPRRTNGAIKNADSSMKTSQAFRREAFFLPGAIRT